jgi:hypothetical protein
MEKETNIDSKLKEDIINIVYNILDENHSDAEKRNLNIKNSQLEMACPVCGDSHKNHSKKRGILYLDSFKFYCWNGDCSAKYWSIFKFFRHFGKNIKNIEHINNISDIIKKSSLQRKNIKLQDSSDYFEFLYNNSISIQNLKSFYNLVDFSECSWGTEFLKKRAIIRYRYNFLFRINEFNKKEVWVLNKIDESEHVVGIQIKNLDYGVKYTTKNFEALHKEMNITLPEMETDFLEKCNNFSTIFNIFNIDIENTVTIFEGPIDAMFINNSIATAGASKLKHFFDDLDNVRFFFDNDKTGKINSIDKIKKGKKSFLWKKFFKDNNFKEKRIKDLNDLILYILNNKDYKNCLKNLNLSFSNSKYDIYNV